MSFLLTTPVQLFRTHELIETVGHSLQFLFLVPGPLVNLTFGESRSHGEFRDLLLGPIRTLFEFLDQKLDLTFVLPDSVRLPAALTKNAARVNRLLVRVLLLETRRIEAFGRSRLKIFPFFEHCHPFVRRLVNSLRVKILNSTGSVHLRGLLARDGAGVALLALLTSC